MLDAPKITTDLLRFITVRNPEPASTGSASTTFATTASTGYTPSSYYSSLVAKRAESVPSAEIISLLKATATDFSQTGAFYENEGDWEPLIPKLNQFIEQVSALETGQLNVAEVKQLAQASFGTTAGLVPENEPALIQSIWDNLITYNILGGDARSIQFTMNALKIKGLLTHIEQNPETQDLSLNTVSVLLPNRFSLFLNRSRKTTASVSRLPI